MELLIIPTNSNLSFSSFYHIFLFASMLGEIAGVGIYQSKGKKGENKTFVYSIKNLWYNIKVITNRLKV